MEYVGVLFDTYGKYAVNGLGMHGGPAGNGCTCPVQQSNCSELVFSYFVSVVAMEKAVESKWLSVKKTQKVR